MASLSRHCPSVPSEPCAPATRSFPLPHYLCAPSFHVLAHQSRPKLLKFRPLFSSSCAPFHFPYPVSPVFCRSYQNCRGVYQQFPFRNSPLRARCGRRLPRLGRCVNSVLPVTCHGPRITVPFPIPFLFTLLRTLCALLHSPRPQPLCFQAIPHSLPKTTRGGGRSRCYS